MSFSIYLVSLFRRSGCAGRPRQQWVLAVALLLTANAALGQTRAAQVMAVTGNVTAVDAQGRERALEKGADVRQGDKIVTGEGALVQMRMTDGGYISVRSATEMAIDRFNYDDKEAANSSVLFSLIKGGFRSITGLIGRTNPGAYSVRTTTATVGIRGTDHEPVVVLPGAPGGVPAGLYDKVNDGETFIRTERGQLALLKGQVGFAPIVPDRPPQALPSVPEFYRIEIKTDARDPKDVTGSSGGSGGSGGKAGEGDAGALRPSLAARRESLKDATKDATNALGTSATTSTLSSTLTDSATTTLTTDRLSTSTLLAPATATTSTTTKDLSSTSTLLTAPTLGTATTTKDLTTTTTSTLLTAPALTTTTSTVLTAPALTTTTSTLLTAPITSTSTVLTAPALSTSTLLSAPATSTVLTAPTTSTTSTTSTLKSTTLIAPTTTTTIKSIITK